MPPFDIGAIGAAMRAARVRRVRFPDGLEVEIDLDTIGAPAADAIVDAPPAGAPRTADDVLFWSAPDSIAPVEHPESEP